MPINQSINLPKISVIMPVLNRADTIEKALESILAQNYSNTELIIIDGGSTDQTIEIIKRYEKHITYWHSRIDGSAALASNIGIEKASGDLINFLMADDYYQPGLFHQISQAYLSHSDADLFTCMGKMVRFNEKTKTYQTLAMYDSPQQLKLNFYNICYGSSVLCFRFIKKSLYQRIGLYIPFDQQQKPMITTDKEFLLRVVLHQAKDVLVHYYGYTYLAHSGSSSFNENHRVTYRKHCSEHCEIAKMFLEKRNKNQNVYLLLSLNQKLLLHYWYLDQSAKLMFLELIENNFKSAGKLWMENIKQYHLLWIGMCCVSSVHVMVRQLCRKIQNLI